MIVEADTGNLLGYTIYPIHLGNRMATLFDHFGKDALVVIDNAALGAGITDFVILERADDGEQNGFGEE